MSAEIVNFNDSVPAAPSGNINVKWQKGSSPIGTDPNTGYPIYDTSAYIPSGAGTLVIGFALNTGVTGTSVAPLAIAPRTATINSVVVVTKTSDATIPFQFDIRKNGTSIFTGTLPTVAAGTAASTVSTFTSLTTVPLTVTKSDVFSINIIQGSASWQCTVQAET